MKQVVGVIMAVYNNTLYYVRFSNRTRFYDDVIEIYILPPGQELYSKSLPYIVHPRALIQETGYKTGLRNGITLSTSKYAMQLLKPPYKTYCHDYTESHFQSRQHCFTSCLLNYSTTRLGEVPPSDYFKNASSDYRFYQIKSTTQDLIKVSNDCRYRSCSRVDCHTELFVPHVVSTFAFDQLQIALLCPLNPDISSTYKPQLTFVDYLTYILSSFGFWTGIAPLTFFLSQNPFKRKNLPKTEKLFEHRIESVNDRIVADLVKRVEILEKRNHRKSGRVLRIR